MKRFLYTLTVLFWGSFAWGQALPTPTNLHAKLDGTNRVLLTWDFNGSDLFSPIYPDAKLWFEIHVDNGYTTTITRTPDYTYNYPQNKYIFTGFYVKPNSSYAFKVKAFFKQSVYSVDRLSALSATSNTVTASTVEYGFTVLTHGFQLMGSMGNVEDFEKHARSIRNRLGGNATIMVNSGVQGYWKIMSYNGLQMGDLDKTKELIFLFDWSTSSNGNSTGAESGELEMAADRLFSMLVDVKVENPVTKQIENWYSNGGMFQKKNHFIGHSRGVPLLLQVFHRFGKYFPSYRINHFTSLDPHPAPKYGDIVYDDNYPLAPPSPANSLPGVVAYETPNDCGSQITAWNVASALGDLYSGNLASATVSILQPLLYNEFLSPICKNAGNIGLSLPFNVEKAENYYRETDEYEKLFYLNPRIENIYNALGAIHSIYSLSSFDPNMKNKAKLGSAGSQLKAIRTKLLRDLESIKSIVEIGTENFSASDLARLEALFEQLQTVYPGVTSMSSLSKTDPVSLVEGLINLEVDKAFKIAPFNGIKIIDNTQPNEWNVKLNDEIMSSGFSADNFFNSEALGTLLGGQHSGVHHWYFSTVDPNNRNVGANWFSSANGLKPTATQLTSGYYYSRIGGKLAQNTYNWPKSTLQYYESALTTRQGQGLQPIFNSSFMYGEVGWFGCNYLHSVVIKNLKKFPILVAKTPGEYIYEINGNLKTQVSPSVQLKHQFFYLPANLNYLKFKINGNQSVALKVSVSFKLEHANVQTFSACNDIISFTSGTDQVYYCSIPQNAKGKVVALILDFSHESSAQYENFIKNVYLDDIEVTNDVADATLLTLQNTSYCREPYYHGSTALDLKSTWDKGLTTKSNSYGFVNWQNRKEFPNWYLKSTSDKNFGIYKNTKITWGEAAESVVLVAHKLGVPEFSQICGNGVSQQELALKHLISNNYIANKDISERIRIGELYELLFKVILDNGSVAYPVFSRPNTKTVYTGYGNSYISRAIQSGGVVHEGNKIYVYWLSDGFEEGKISGNETVSRVVLSKTVTLAYEFKKFQLNNVASNVNNGARLNLLNSENFVLDDFTTIGSRFELEENEGLFPTVQIDGKTEYLRSGAIVNFFFSRDTLADGTKVHFFWSLNGTSKGTSLTSGSSNFQSVQLSMPSVTKEEKFTFYVYVGASNGRSAEMFKEIYVRPSDGNNISTIEYFFDSDPGFGMGSKIELDGNNYGIDYSFSIDMSAFNLSQGVHTLGIRTKSTASDWSLTHTRPFLVLGMGSGESSEITHVEYFYDSLKTDKSNLIAQSVTPDGFNSIALPLNINLSQGVHTVSFRAKDNTGKYSLFHTRPFLVLGIGAGSSNLITHVEYFFDTDPGLGSGTQVPYSADNNGNTVLNLNLGAMSAGVHTLYVRVRDNKGSWSLTHVRPFVIMPVIAGSNATIQKVEYFLDNNDPGRGLASNVPFTSGQDVTVNFDLNLTTLSVGEHVLSVRVQDSNGNWSAIRNISFTRPQNLCENNKVISIAITSGNQEAKAGNSIIATNKVSGQGTRVSYGADAVTLLPGFEVGGGAVFTVNQKGCDN